MNFKLSVSLISILFSFSNFCDVSIAKEWSTPEALRAFGAPGDTVRVSASSGSIKTPATTKIIKNRKLSEEQLDNSSTLKFSSDDLVNRYGRSTPEQMARESQNAGAANARHQNELNEQNRQLIVKEQKRAAEEQVRYQNEQRVREAEQLLQQQQAAYYRQQQLQRQQAQQQDANEEQADQIRHLRNDVRRLQR